MVKQIKEKGNEDEKRNECEKIRGREIKKKEAARNNVQTKTVRCKRKGQAMCGDKMR